MTVSDAPRDVRDQTALGRLRRGLDALDALLDRDAPLDAIVERAAASFGVALGVRTAAGTRVAADPRGPLPAGPFPDGARRRRLSDGSRVWLLPRPGAGGDDTDDLETVALRCFADAVERALARSGHRRVAADIRTLVDELASAQDHRDALHRLGLHERSPVTLLALVGPSAGVDRVLDSVAALSSPVHHLRDGAVHLVLAEGLDDPRHLDIPIGVRGAFTPPCPAARASSAWRRARTALRFAMPSTHATGPYPRSEAVLVDSAGIGSYAILAEQLTAEELAQVPDVQKLARLLLESGPEMEQTLLTVAATDSLRQAARIVHLHHNSVAHRVQRAEKVLGFSCVEPYGRARLLLTLTLHRLLESHKLF